MVEQTSERFDFIDRTLQDMFAHILHEASGEPPQLRDVRVEFDEYNDALRLRARFHVEGQRDDRDRFVERSVRHWDIPRDYLRRVRDGRVFYEADAMWSRMYEDHYINRAMRVAEQRLAETVPDGWEFAARRQELGRLRGNIDRFHQDSYTPRFTYDLSAEALAPRDMTAETSARAAEVSRRIEEHMLRTLGISERAQSNSEGTQDTLTIETIREAARALGRNPYHQDWRRAFDVATEPDRSVMWRVDVVYGRRILRNDGMVGIGDLDVGSAEAQQRGLALLKENLTPAQRAQYETHKYFDVKGGKTGKTYRIHHGRQMNIRQIDRKGQDVCGWCFLPRGGLVAGDVMLAQKAALESFEDEALKIANRF